MNSPPESRPALDEHISHISTLGKNSFTDLAAQKLAAYYADSYGVSIDVINHPDAESLWQSQQNGSAMLLPLYNAGSGLVRKHWKYMIGLYKDPTLKIVADIDWQVRMCLCGKPSTDPQTAVEAISHFQGLWQCSNLVGDSLIEKGVANATVTRPGTLQNIRHHTNASSTAEALQIVAQSSSDSIVGIGSEQSARENGLTIFNNDASNLPAAENITQMLLMQRVKKPKKFDALQPYHTLFVTVKNQRGAFRDLLRTIANTNTEITAFFKRSMQRDQPEVQCLLELDTTKATRADTLEEAINDLPNIKKTETYTPTWDSWRDRVTNPGIAKNPCTPIEWSALHANVDPTKSEFTVTVLPKQQINSLNQVMGIITDNCEDVIIFNTAVLGKRKFSFTIKFSLNWNQSMHDVLDKLQQVNVLDEIRFE